jgi:hypothetical protein
MKGGDSGAGGHEVSGNGVVPSGKMAAVWEMTANLEARLLRYVLQ